MAGEDVSVAPPPEPGWTEEQADRFQRNEPVIGSAAPPGADPAVTREMVAQQSLMDYPTLRNAAIGASQVGVGLVEDAAAIPRWGVQGYNLITGRDTSNIPNWLKPEVIGYNMTPNDLRPISSTERVMAGIGRGAGEGMILGPRGALAGAVAGGTTGLLREIDSPTGVNTVAGAGTGASVGGAETIGLGAASFLFHHHALLHLARQVLARAAPNIGIGAGVGGLAGSTSGDLAPGYRPPGQRNPLTDYSGEQLPSYATTMLNETQNVLQAQRAAMGARVQ